MLMGGESDGARIAGRRRLVQYAGTRAGARRSGIGGRKVKKSRWRYDVQRLSSSSSAKMRLRSEVGRLADGRDCLVGSDDLRDSLNCSCREGPVGVVQFVIP